jgi:short-subunit dehydrogenase
MDSATRKDPQHALIIGAGPGLGAALARRFGREQFTVTLLARREDALNELADELRTAGVTVDIATADAAEPHEYRKALEELAGRINPDVVIYNAALIAPDNVLTADLDHLESAYAVDALGAISTAQVFTPAMRRAGRGTFLATGGDVGVDPQPAYATLSLGKAGLRAAVTLMHQELKADGVHAASVTVAGAIAPGTALDPDRIAETYWSLHTQPASVWTAETYFDGHQWSRPANDPAVQKERQPGPTPYR